MSMKSGSLDNWRNYFRSANGDIFDIIDHAVMVAALDCPKEFKLRRDRIAEKLFTCKLTRCSGCDRVELAVPSGNEFDDDEEDCKRDGCEFEAGGSKESKVNSCRDDHVSNQIVSNFSSGDIAEALTDEIEEESQVVGEVLRIKEILHNSRDESDSVLFESLRRLQLMALTVDTLKATEIGKAVNGLRKHGSKQIRHLARTLIEGWKDLVDEWVNATKAIAEGTPDSVNPSVVDEEEGLPSPPLDELAFFTGPSAGIELSQFFDGMDDFGNPRNSGEFIKNRESGRKPSVENQNIAKRKQQTPNEPNVLAKDNNSLQMKRQEAVVRPNKPSNKPSNTNSGPGRPLKQNMGQKVDNESKLQQKSDKAAINKKPLNSQHNKLKSPDEDAVQVKLEATKRKLQESYQLAENAKKQRTIQVMELHDLPKQGLGNRNPQLRPGNYNRHWANGRR
ncbi:putative mediator of RNA polymerase II transcription subunit 26b [Citrus sinensis]|uniref:Mediator of RNA polymerase II transcription subunit 26b n=1 Tax=Citrus sinensis TaxID=2711 RepID=A0ACB8K257_CITSI|nr:putative mediator of RNA polymerase II transcription subunit 26b [Citrus sinensis]